VHKGISMSPTYPVEDQTGECHMGVGDHPEIGEGESGNASKSIATELAESGKARSEPLVTDAVNNAGEKGESTGRYNLRPRPGRIV
jgi:hypothetical protein